MKIKSIVASSVFVISTIILSIPAMLNAGQGAVNWYGAYFNDRITSYNVCYTKLLRK